MFDKNKQDPAAPTQQRPNANADQQPRVNTESPGSDSQPSDMAVIGRSIKIDGDLRGEEDLRIEGDVNGKIELPNHNLTIGQKGRIKADAYAKSVIVDGEMKGDLYGSEAVIIRANAHVEGNVIASRVSLEEGARFKGSIDMDPERVKEALGDRLDTTEQAGDPGRAPGSKPTTASVNSHSAERTAKAKSSKAEPAHQ